MTRTTQARRILCGFLCLLAAVRLDASYLEALDATRPAMTLARSMIRPPEVIPRPNRAMTSGMLCTWNDWAMPGFSSMLSLTTVTFSSKGSPVLPLNSRTLPEQRRPSPGRPQ